MITRRRLYFRACLLIEAAWLILIAPTYIFRWRRYLICEWERWRSDWFCS